MTYAHFGITLLGVLIIIAMTTLIFLALRHYERTKMRLFDGMAALPDAKLNALGWTPKEAVTFWHIKSWRRIGWIEASRRHNEMSTTLQRVLLRGLPKHSDVPETAKRAALQYRLYFFLGLMPVAGLIFLSALLRYPVLWVAMPLLVLFPLQKFQRWPSENEVAS